MLQPITMLLGCVFIQKSGGNLWATVYMFTVLFFGLILPFVTILYMNSVIIVTIRTGLKYRRKCAVHSASSGNAGNSSSSGEVGRTNSGEVVVEVDEKECKACAQAKKPLSAQVCFNSFYRFYRKYA